VGLHDLNGGDSAGPQLREELLDGESEDVRPQLRGVDLKRSDRPVAQRSLAVGPLAGEKISNGGGGDMSLRSWRRRSFITKEATGRMKPSKRRTKTAKNPKCQTSIAMLKLKLTGNT
jgi:hypothetical protein